LVFVLPLTRTDRRIPAHIPIDPPERGVQGRSYVLCDAIRSITNDRLTGSAWGQVSPETMERVGEMLRILMDL
jgi:mRNA interferase MazF